MPKLSIITICYNDPKVEKTLQSITSQTWQDFEWIVIDGGSNQQTLDIFAKYQHRIDKFISEPDRGIYDAYNKGLSMSSGEYVNFMNAGDCFKSADVLKLAIQFLNESSHDIYYGEYEHCYNTHTTISNYPQMVNRDYFFQNSLNTQSLFIKRSLFEKLGYFDLQYRIYADYDKMLQFITSNVQFKYIPIVVSSFDMYGISSQKNNNNEPQTIRNKYYTEEEKQSFQYTFKERLFSIKKPYQKNHRVFCLLGLRIKIHDKRKS